MQRSLSTPGVVPPDTNLLNTIRRPYKVVETENPAVASSFEGKQDLWRHSYDPESFSHNQRRLLERVHHPNSRNYQKERQVIPKVWKGDPKIEFMEERVIELLNTPTSGSAEESETVAEIEEEQSFLKNAATFTAFSLDDDSMQRKDIYSASHDIAQTTFPLPPPFHKNSYEKDAKESAERVASKNVEKLDSSSVSSLLSASPFSSEPSQPPPEDITLLISDIATSVKVWMDQNRIDITENTFHTHIANNYDVLKCLASIISKIPQQTDGNRSQDECFSRLKNDVKILEAGREQLLNEISTLKAEKNMMKYKLEEQLLQFSTEKQRHLKAKNELKHSYNLLAQRLAQAQVDLNKERQQNSILSEKLRSVLSSKDISLKEHRRAAVRGRGLSLSQTSHIVPNGGDSEAAVGGRTEWQQHCQKAFDFREKHLLSLIKTLKGQLRQDTAKLA